MDWKRDIDGAGSEKLKTKIFIPTVTGKENTVKKNQTFTQYNGDKKPSSS